MFVQSDYIGLNGADKVNNHLYSEKFRRSELYTRLSVKALSSLTAGDVYTELQKINLCGESALEAFDFLNRLLKALQMYADGSPMNKTVTEDLNAQIDSFAITAGTNVDVCVAGGDEGFVTIVVDPSATATITGDGDPMVLVPSTVIPQFKAFGPLNVASATGVTYVLKQKFTWLGRDND